jgi:sulfate transport system ATP-binding protein
MEMEQVMAEQNYVELRQVNKKYKDFQASDDINFGIGKGKLIGLLGPSGSGKTTILRMLAGLEHADSGEIIIDGRVVNDVPASERGIGFVFQNYNLVPVLNVYENIVLPVELDGDSVDKKSMQRLYKGTERVFV